MSSRLVEPTDKECEIENMRYLPLTEDEKTRILEKCGVGSFEELTPNIPEELRVKGLLNLPSRMSEAELLETLEKLSSINKGAWMQNHLGQGVYDHTCPTWIDQILGRGEFLTSYTPYQPEVTQGTLQGIFEFQSMIAELFGMEVSNASLYDGATAVLEAVLMAVRTRKNNKPIVYISEGTYDNTRKILESCLPDMGIEVRTWWADPKSLESTPETFENDCGGAPAAIVLQSPNRWGVVEDWAGLDSVAKKENARSVAYVSHALSLGIFSPPGEHDIDIAVGEGQALGIPPGFGGPHLGLFCCKKADIRQMPGRLVGHTEDARGQQAFCVTLSTREQHIRREKATSNICSNQNLMALKAAMYMTAMGPEGLSKLGKGLRSRIFYLRTAIENKFKEKNIPHQVVQGELFNELTIMVGPKHSLWVDEKITQAQDQGILIGLDVSVPRSSGCVRGLNIAVTERHYQSDLDKLVEILGES